ncbi:hypothetical protein PMAYCL1PPCAC_02574, partial [Pristionchus mayeri]
LHCHCLLHCRIGSSTCFLYNQLESTGCYEQNNDWPGASRIAVVLLRTENERESVQISDRSRLIESPLRG